MAYIKSVSAQNRERLKAKSKIRECLKCGKPFKSLGPGNRLCNSCNLSNRGINYEPFKTGKDTYECSDGERIIDEWS